MPVKQLLAGAAVLFVQASTVAACPPSVAVGSPEAPVELVSVIKDDPDFAKMQLDTISRVLPEVRQSCSGGVQDNCRLADFLDTARRGLACYAGVTLPTDAGVSSTASQMHYGSVRTITGTGNSGNGQGQNAAASAQRRWEECRCGADYVSCWTRISRAGTYRLSSANGWDNITFYDTSGKVASVKGWKRGTNECSAIVK
jgi:hypothetical protein